MTLADRITEAEAAVHKLLTGSLREEVSYANGDRIRFAATDIAKLQEYLAALKAEAAGGSTRGAIGIVF